MCTPIYGTYMKLNKFYTKFNNIFFSVNEQMKCIRICIYEEMPTSSFLKSRTNNETYA